MTYYSSTRTEPANKDSEAKFESNATHHVILVSWEHCYKETTDIKVTNSPLKIEATSHDGMNYHRLELSLSLNYDIVSLADAFYDTNDKGFSIHIPKKDMQLRKPETVSLPKKS